MPRRKSKKPSLRGYFKTLLEAHPEWLPLKDNTDILDQWERDNPNEPVTPKIRANLASLKSKMRAQNRGGPVLKPGLKAKSSSNLAPSAAVPDLEKLEIMIDECVSRARNMGVNRLEPVIRHLRIARAQIVLMFDQEL